MAIVKLLAYSLLGYVLYELYLGLSEGAPALASHQPRGRGGARSQRTVNVEGPGGSASKRAVGRGVVGS
ncbi:MAG: hypothetical protein JO353_03640 [Phycisphaerae bacterium]|nr:hypothetical protein [Phycisphaerae bacterium]